MSGIRLYQPNGVGLVNEAGAQHPAPIELDVGQICQLAFTGTTSIYRWFLSKPSNSGSVLSSGSSAGPSFVPDIDGGSYSISLFDSDEVEYILDIVTPTTGIGGGSGGGTTVTTTIEDYATVRASSFTGGAPPASIVVLRRENVGDGGEGTFVLLEGDSSTDDDDGTVLVDSDGNRFKRIFMGAVDARWFGVVAYSTITEALVGTDSLSALQTACRLQNNEVTATYKVVMPFGFIRISGTLEISRRIILCGQGMFATMLLPDFTGDDAIIVNDSARSSDGGDGAQATLCDFNINFFSSFSGKDGRGIVVNAAGVTVENIALGRIPGISIQQGDNIGTTGNSHFCTFRNIRIFNPNGDAFFAYYGNASLISDVKVQGGTAGARHFVEETDLGNYYFGCYSEAPPSTPFTSGTRVSHGGLGGGVNRSVFVGCYAEGGENTLEGPCVWIGGDPVGGFSDGATHGGALIFLSAQEVYPFRMVNSRSGDETARMFFGDVDDDGRMYGFESPSPFSSESYALHYRQDQGLWRFCRATADTDTVYAWTGGYSDRRFGQFHVPNLLVGEGGVGELGVRMTSGDAEPDAGLWHAGDLQLNSDREPGAPVLWQASVPGGFGLARTNGHPYGFFEIISVSGRAYACVEAGTSAGSPPSFNFSALGDLTTDGGAIWSYIGSDAPTFEAVYADDAPTMLSKDVTSAGTITLTEAESAHKRIKFTGSPGAGLTVVVAAGAGAGWVRTFWNASGQTVRIKASSGDTGVDMRDGHTAQIFSDGTNARPVTDASNDAATSRESHGPYWFSNAADWSTDSWGRIVSGVSTASSYYRVIDVPVGATLTKVTAFIAAPVHASLPANMPRITLHTLTMSTNSTSSSAAAVDQTAAAGDYDDPHVIERTVSNVVQDGDKRFVLQFENESSTNAASGLTVIEIFATFTPNGLDRGAT